MASKEQHQENTKKFWSITFWEVIQLILLLGAILFAVICLGIGLS